MRFGRRRLLGLGLVSPLLQLGTPPLRAQEVQPRVRPGVALRFPRDFGAHPDYRTEWWYLTGELRSPDAARPFGFQVTFFRSRGNLPADHPSAFAARQLVFAHAAVTDLSAGRLLHAQRIARAGFGIAQAHEQDTNVVLRGWHLRREGSPGQGLYRTAVEAADFRLALEIADRQPVLLQGHAGYSRKGPDPSQASYYYSKPQMAVSGRLSLGGHTHPVQGRAWFDHEWSEALMHPEAVGWDWIGMNLDDGAALTAFRLRRHDGSALWAGGSFRPAGAEARSFSADEVHFTPLKHWDSPATRARYPVLWHIETPAGRFEVQALLDAQELDGASSTGSVYWEGLSELRDAGRGTRLGSGYLEMTGYAGVLRL